MIPEHCSQVSMQDVDFEPTPETVSERLMGQKVYHRTRYLVLRFEADGGQMYSIVEVDGPGYGMFKHIEEVKVISTPEDTSFLRAPDADAFNHNSLSEAVKDVGTRAVVVEAEFDHITFVVREDPIVVTLVDVVPPHPSKLLVLAQRALRTMTLTRPVVLIPKIVDITEMVEAEEIIYPCRATDMGRHSHAKFLHECPVISEDGVLVGCEISRKIFYSHYKRRPKFVNICPKEFAKEVEGLRLIKCCLVEGKVEFEADMAIVPWGVRLEEIREAIQGLLAMVEEMGPGQER